MARNFTNSHGNLLFGPIQVNTIYGFVLTACSFNWLDCISTEPRLYAKSLSAPLNLGALNLTLINSSAVQLDWDAPESPNDFSLFYTVFRRDTCLGDDLSIGEFNSSARGNDSWSCLPQPDSCVANRTHTCCGGVAVEQKYGFECCDGNYQPKPFETPTVCCGGRFYKLTQNYQCCAGFFYAHVPPGQVCCSNLDNPNDSEIRYLVL